MNATGEPGTDADPPGPRRFADFAGLVQHLREPGLPPAVISPRRFGEALNVDLQTLAAWAHVHRNTVQRAPGAAALQAYLRDALSVIRAAIDTAGSTDAALFWFRNEPLPAFDFVTPARVVSTLGPDPLLRSLRTDHRIAGPRTPTWGS